MGNPKTSEWYSTPKARRTRQQIALTLSLHAKEKLRKLAKKTGYPRSRVVEWLILDAGAEGIALLSATQEVEKT
jgi:hypothetical protein